MWTVRKVILSVLTITSMSTYAQIPSGDKVCANVNARDEGDHVIQSFDMILTNSRGKTQTRETVIYRKDFPDQRKSIIVFTNPTNVKGTGFMSYDYNEASEDDDQWLYLPALKKTRRISASNRGDYFLGTDFTYEDIKLGSKMGLADYSFKTIKEETIDGKKCYLVEAIPVDGKTQNELGYSKVHHWVDSEIWLIRQSKYWDVAGNLLKTTNVQSVEKIDDIWTIKKLIAENHKTGHKTEITFSNVDYNTSVADDIFTEESLVRGVQ